MKNIWYLVVFVAVCVVGCTTAILSRDMLLANQGFDLLNQGKYTDAEKRFDEALAENPDNPFALLNQGVVYQTTGRTEKAKSMYEKVIKLNPKETAGRSSESGKTGKTLVEIAKENLEAL
jgi:Tfp pilus assembly protein PilF